MCVDPLNNIIVRAHMCPDFNIVLTWLTGSTVRHKSAALDTMPCTHSYVHIYAERTRERETNTQLTSSSHQQGRDATDTVLCTYDIHARAYVCKHRHEYGFIYISVYLHTCTHADARPISSSVQRMNMRTCPRTRIHKCRCSTTYTYTRPHMHIQTRRCSTNQ